MSLKSDWNHLLYLVFDPGSVPQPDPWRVLEESLQGGVSLVQLREKSCSDEEFLRLALRMRPILDRFGVPLILNDRLHLVERAGARGVHLGQGDFPWLEARKLLGSAAILGVSVESVDQARAADRPEVDYLGVSAIFPTATKTDHATVWGTEGLRALRAQVSRPLVAIGGIHSGNVREVVRAGADSVAVVSAICASADPRACARDLLAAARTPPRALTIAGSDSGGGAGIQADLKTFTALKVYGASALTALTAQNTRGVRSVQALSPEFVAEQLEAVLEDIGADAVKIGMLFDAGIIRAVAGTLERFRPAAVILDPVMVAKGGDRLLREEAVDALKTRLLPLCHLVTPNLPEAEVLSGRSIRDPSEMEEASDVILAAGPQAVLMKGGHLSSGAVAADFLNGRDRNGGTFREWFEAPRITTPNTHGTGCTLSAAIAAFSARGENLRDAVRSGKAYLTRALEEGARFRLGSGHGPVDHMFAIDLNCSRS